ncbi:hypothetical protein R0011_05447 [Lacticaseibacillus rhamnosus R0011]|nr:Hypothetical protein LOCK900_2678 [Lacticaseibacillus rhamnosus LOCK900]EHJ22714.1 hypothetical protein R0011_05447 [Lacticaseibacillus rhamnosus R0011]EHJ29310.1 hypothetical protein HMPREF0541_01992 [Lacticaseibacillus rhamnosus ATCC 21052]
MPQFYPQPPDNCQTSHGYHRRQWLIKLKANGEAYLACHHAFTLDE